MDDEEQEDIRQPTLRGGPDKLRVSRKAIARYGATEGCRACTAIEGMGHLRNKLNCNHSAECRRRIIKLMQVDPKYRGLMEKHGYIDNGTPVVEMVSDAQREEMLGHIRKAIHNISRQAEYKESEKERRLDRAMMEILIANIQVAEVYSPARVTAMAKTMGLRAGWSLDLTTRDIDGRPWNFNDPEMRNRAIRRLI